MLFFCGGMLVLVFSFFVMDGHSQISLPRFSSTTSPSSISTPLPTVAPIIKPTAKPTIVPTAKTILLNVPYAVQAPFGNWSDPKEENGCEEVSAVMAMHWVNGTILTPTEALSEIIAISDYEKTTYGQFIDTSAQDTADRIFRGYFKYTNVSVKYSITVASIIAELRAGHIVIIPVNGQKVGNPYYKQPGPLEHMILIKGYDPTTNEFITNDPGTRKGESYRYSTNVLFNAIRNYFTEGNHQHKGDDQKVMIVVTK